MLYSLWYEAGNSWQVFNRFLAGLSSSNAKVISSSDFPWAKSENKTTEDEANQMIERETLVLMWLLTCMNQMLGLFPNVFLHGLYVIILNVCLHKPLYLTEKKNCHVITFSW